MTTDYRPLLADLVKRRDLIDGVISSLQTLIGDAPAPVAARPKPKPTHGKRAKAGGYVVVPRKPRGKPDKVTKPASATTPPTAPVQREPSASSASIASARDVAILLRLKKGPAPSEVLRDALPHETDQTASQRSAALMGPRLIGVVLAGPAFAALAGRHLVSLQPAMFEIQRKRTSGRDTTA